MSIIQDISGLTNDLHRLKKDQSLKKTAERTSTDKAAQAYKNAEKQGGIRDSVTISETGKSLLQQQEMLDQFKNDLKEIETLDKDQLLSIHKKIAERHYEEPEVLARIVDNVVQESPEPEAVAAGNPDADIADIRDKIKNGFYNSDDMAEKIAEKILSPGF